MSDGFKIESLHAWVAVDPADGDEGIIAFQDAKGMWLPMIAADRTRLEELRPRAEQVGRDLNITVRLLRFDQRTTVEIIEPKGDTSD